MTNNQLTDERLVKILSETQATIMEHNSRCVRGSVEVDARLYESMIMELQERRKADSDPVAVVEPSDYVTAAQLVGEGPARKAVHELYEGALRIGDKLYRHAQPAPVVQENSDPRDAFEAVFPMPKHAQRCGDGYAVTSYGAWTAYEFVKKWEGWNAFRAAMLNGGKP